MADLRMFLEGEDLFVYFFSVPYIVEQNGFFFFVNDVDDSEVSISKGPFAFEVAF